MLSISNENSLKIKQKLFKDLYHLTCEWLPLKIFLLIHGQYIIHFAWIYLTHDTILGVHPKIFYLPDDLLAVSKMQIRCVKGWRWVVKNKWFKRIICHVAHTKNSKKRYRLRYFHFTFVASHLVINNFFTKIQRQFVSKGLHSLSEVNRFSRGISYFVSCNSMIHSLLLFSLILGILMNQNAWHLAARVHQTPL